MSASYPPADKPWPREMKAHALYEIETLRAQLGRVLSSGSKVVEVAEHRGRRLTAIATIASHEGDVILEEKWL